LYETFSSFIKNLADNNSVFVIKDNRRIIATSTIIIEQKLIRSAGKVAHVEDVVIDKEYRGMSLGNRMINYCVDYAKSMGCYKIILDCDNKVKQFYEKCGFTNK
jgi:Acetyltransferases